MQTISSLFTSILNVSPTYLPLFTGALTMAFVSGIFVLNRIKINAKKQEIDRELLKTIRQLNKELINKGHDIVSIQGAFNQLATTSSVLLNSKKSLHIKSTLKKKQKETETEKGVIISTLFLSEKLKKIYKTYLALGIASLLALLLSFYFQITFLISSLILVLIILVFLYQFVLSYRVKNGLFGSNSYEAQELLEFLVKNKDKIDGNGNGLFNEESLNEIVLDMSTIIENMGATR